MSLEEFQNASEKWLLAQIVKRILQVIPLLRIKNKHFLAQKYIRVPDAAKVCMYLNQFKLNSKPMLFILVGHSFETS